MDLTLISDLHGFQPDLPGGDLLIVAGDLTANDTLAQINQFKDWTISEMSKYKKIIVIGGNHDNWLSRKEFFNPNRDSWDHPHLCYLEDSGTEFEGLKIWGSPWTHWFDGVNPHCTAFMTKSSEELASKWALIPDDVDILITHSPPYGILDEAEHIYMHGDGYENCGSTSLRDRLEKIHPKLHVFGHIHEGAGKLVFKRPGFGDENNTLCVNASIMDLNYKPNNKPIRVTL